MSSGIWTHRERIGRVCRRPRPGVDLPGLVVACVVASLALLAGTPSPAEGLDGKRLRAFALAADTEALRPEGAAVLPRLARLYESTASAHERAQIARVFYQRGWTSPEAKRFPPVCPASPKAIAST